MELENSRKIHIMPKIRLSQLGLIQWKIGLLDFWVFYVSEPQKSPSPHSLNSLETEGWLLSVNDLLFRPEEGGLHFREGVWLLSESPSEK